MNGSLQSENYSLRRQLETRLLEARRNEEKMRRFDQLERQLIGADSRSLMPFTIASRLTFAYRSTSLYILPAFLDPTQIED